MEEMKYDMSGAAAVLGTFDVLGRLRPRLNVVGLIPTTENLPSGTAVKPGDVIKSHFGKTIEIVNTDAEGRLILCDALSYARRYKPVGGHRCGDVDRRRRDRAGQSGERGDGQRRARWRPRCATPASVRASAAGRCRCGTNTAIS